MESDDTIKIDALDKKECMRYMGASGLEPEGVLKDLIEECEEVIKKEINPKYVYRVLDANQIHFPGNEIAEHLKGCEKIVMMCATVSANIDRLLRKTEITDMTKALIYDCMASVAVEEICEQVEMIIRKKLPQYYMTWRYGVGYGDFPLEYQDTFLRILDATKLIGVHVSENHILIPRKSVTCVIGLSRKPILNNKRGCASCNMRERCQFRKKGERCGF